MINPGMMDPALGDGVLEIRRVLPAAPPVVFDAWVQREEWQAWIGPEGIDCDVPQFDAHVGGRYRLTMHLPDGTLLPVTGVFRAVEPPTLLAFTWGREGDSRETLVTVTLRDLGGGRTKLTLRHEGFDSAAARDDHENGWGSCLNKLAAYLAARFGERPGSAGRQAGAPEQD